MKRRCEDRELTGVFRESMRITVLDTLMEYTMTKVAITADPHLGVHDRLSDILWSLRTIREYCMHAKIDVVFVLGDLYHDRSSLGIDVLSRSADFFEETSEKYGQQWIVFPGNHDMFMRHSWEINSLVHMRKHLTVIDTVKIVEVDDHRFWILPFITYEKSYLRVLRRIEGLHRDGDVLLTHIGIRGASFNTCFLLKDWSNVNFEFSKFDRVYAGHFHSKQQIGENVWYPGSPIPFKFDEGNVPHGFYVYDLDTRTHKFINIWSAGTKLLKEDTVPPPQFCTILDSQLDGIVEDDVRNNIVRVALNKQYQDDEKKQIKSRLIDMGARTVRWMDRTQDLPVSSIPTKTDLPHKNIFKLWLDVDSKNASTLDRSLLEQVNDDIVKEGDELYAADESNMVTHES